MNPTQTITKYRITSIDFLRGTIMIIMALDHVRDYLFFGSFYFDPLDLTKTSGILFFTRWITHFCAPIFMLLAGTSAYLMGQKKTKSELSVFLIKRGIWLVFLEMVVVNFGWNFNIAFPTILFITIWALGISMIVLAALSAGPAHGYAVIEEIRRRSGQAFDLPEGTIYPALHRLEQSGLLVSHWVTAESGRKRRVYALTRRGERALTERLIRDHCERAGMGKRRAGALRVRGQRTADK